jgi:hypothetical protein
MFTTKIKEPRWKIISEDTYSEKSLSIFMGIPTRISGKVYTLQNLHTGKIKFFKTILTKVQMEKRPESYEEKQ